MRNHPPTLKPIPTLWGTFRLSRAARQMLAALANGQTIYLPRSKEEQAESKRLRDQENQRRLKAQIPVIPEPAPLSFSALAQLTANQKILDTLETKGLIAKDTEAAKLRLTPEGWAALEALGAVRRKTPAELAEEKEVQS
jgi:hypothetical protein